MAVAAVAVTHERWEAIYRASFPRVYRAVAAALLDGDAALDALHDAFLEGLRRPPAEDRNLEGWLYRVAVRSGRRSLRRVLRSIGVVARPTTDELERALDRVEIGRLLRRLSARQREIVVAHYFLRLPYDEIAERFEITRGTVSATISRSLARMREGERHEL